MLYRPSLIEFQRIFGWIIWALILLSGPFMVACRPPTRCSDGSSVEYGSFCPPEDAGSVDAGPASPQEGLIVDAGSGTDAGSSDVCQGDVPLNCDDGNPCTIDSCDAQGCVHEAASFACDDGDPCTTGDVCSSGTCQGLTPVSCDDGNACTSDQCGPSGCAHIAVTNGTACASGVCVDSFCTASCLIDGGVVTSASPSPSNGCLICEPASSTLAYSPLADGTACDDQNACTASSSCQAGSCTSGPPLNCDDGNACTQDTCNTTTGCTHTALSCDDGNSCTTDSCGVSGCAHSPVPEGTVCSSGYCSNGACTSGCFIGGSVVSTGAISPLNSCLACTPAVSTSNYSARSNGANCDDGNACTLSSSCSGGTCTGGQAIDCNDGNPCTLDSCNTSTGCFYTQAMNGISCGTNAFCNGGLCSTGCFIGATLFANGAINPVNACQVCTMAVSNTSWSNAPNGTSCKTAVGTGSCQTGTCK